METQSKKGATGILPLMACAALIFCTVGNGEAYNITQGKTSDPKGILWKDISDGSNSKGTCATNATCHTKASNGKYGKIKNSQLLSGNKKFTSYTGGSSYTLTITVPTPGTMNGFQMSARDLGKNSVGTFKKGTNSQVYNATDSDTHKTVGLIENIHNKKNVSSWTFNWTAPAKGTGKVVFYYGLNSANNNAISTDDTAYYGSVTVSEQ